MLPKNHRRGNRPEQLVRLTRLSTDRGVPSSLTGGGRRSFQFPQRTLDGFNIAPVHDPPAVVEDDHRHDIAMVAVAPFPVRFRVLVDIQACMGDSFAGEITFHPGAEESAVADVNGDGRIARSVGGSHGRRSAAKERSCEEEEGERHQPGDLPVRCCRGSSHVRTRHHRSDSKTGFADPTI
jgi:hypothetical protein